VAAVRFGPEVGATTVSTGENAMKKLFTAIALATMIATPAFAATTHHRAGQSTRQLYMSAPQDTGGARAAAMEECNAEASKFSNSAWQTAQFAAYGTCMAAHGQQP
jgi:hypothetical protein